MRIKYESCVFSAALMMALTASHTASHRMLRLITWRAKLRHSRPRTSLYESSSIKLRNSS
jgi:hypothetical protein